jgi:hypothetical protein
MKTRKIRKAEHPEAVPFVNSAMKLPAVNVRGSGTVDPLISLRQKLVATQRGYEQELKKERDAHAAEILSLKNEYAEVEKIRKEIIRLQHDYDSRIEKLK